MQRETNYEKPILKFTPLQNKEDIAETCWGNHSGKYKYYDTVGTGYVGFTLENNSCSADVGLLMYFYKDESDPGTQIFPGDPKYDQVYELVTAEGNYGSPFKGEENFPDSPSGMS